MSTLKEHVSTLKEHVSTFWGVVQRTSIYIIPPPILFQPTLYFYNNSLHFTQIKETLIVENHLIVSVVNLDVI